MRRGVYVITLLLFLIVAAVPLAAQEFTGNINGRVSDSSNAVLPGVNVTLKSTAMQGERAAITDETGGYRFILLAPGMYSVTFELPGFKTIVRDQIPVQVGRTSTVNVGMEVATLAETVTVTGESPVVDVQNATVAVNFTQTLLRDLPNARDLWVVLAQSPGIATTRFDVGGSTMGTQTGYRSFGYSGQNWVNLDGIVTTEGTSAAGIYMDYGSFAEIQVSAAANSAEVPVPGAFINTVVKTGSNALKGEIYFDWEDSSFQGTNLTEQLKDKGITAGDKFTRYNDFNVNVGGPFKKDKFWWFGSVREQFSGLQTELKQNDLTPGAPFTTRLENQTLKLNYQLSQKNAIIFTGQAGRKFQPYRGGSGSSAQFFVVDSTGSQNSWAWAYKGQLTSVLSSRATLDASFNVFGYIFPIANRISETPVRDTGTSTVRGGYSGESTGTTTSTPFANQRRRFHTPINLSYFKDNLLGGNHDFKGGYAFIYEDIRYTQKGVPGSAGTPGHLVLYYNNGTPDQFQIQNTPFRYQDVLNQNYFFIQDKWQIGKRLTLNLGMRYDHYASYSPAQGNPATGPWVTLLGADVKFAKRTFPVFQNLVPRIALVWDVFGNTKTALKAGYGRYGENIGATLASTGNPLSTVITWRYRWDGRPASQITPAYAATLTPLTKSGQATELPVDPKLSNQYTDEYSVGIDHQIVTDLGFHINFVRKLRYNWWDTFNTAQPTSGFAPVTATDLGPDGLAATGNERSITIFNRVVPADVKNLLTNWPAGDNFSTIELGATKRFTHNWQMITGWDWTKRNLKGTLSYDPNQLLYGTDSGAHQKLWTYKLIGTYQLPRGVSVSGTYNAQKGEPYGRRQQFGTANGLSQGTQTLYMEPNGAYYYPTLNLINLRAEKTFHVTERNRITGMFDLFNIQNANTITGVDTLTGRTTDRNNNPVQRFGRATQIINPRIFRLGIRYMF